MLIYFNRGIKPLADIVNTVFLETNDDKDYLGS